MIPATLKTNVSTFMFVFLSFSNSQNE